MNFKEGDFCENANTRAEWVVERNKKPTKSS